MTHRIGVISDTHGILRTEALDALSGVHGIIHAGDVGAPEVLAGLRRVAPLTVVRGNVDRAAWAECLPQTAEIEVAGRWFHVRHILEELDIDPSAAGFDAVVYGHSHRPSVERRRGVLYLNPGSAGPRRFRLPISLAIVDVDSSGIRAELVTLAV